MKNSSSHSRNGLHASDAKRHFHFIGIGGAGTSGLAELLLMQGERVSGSDLVKAAKTAELEALGATVYEGHSASNIADDVQVVIHSSAVHSDNEEFVEAGRRGIRLVRRADFMGELLADHKVIAVAGTHGKTTTTSMIASILIEAKLDPVVLVGASVKELGGKNARAGKGKIAVVEADEYDRSFLTLHPFVAVMTSLEAEHLDIYKDLTDLKDTFVRFANQGPSTWNTGYAVMCIDEPALREITPRLEKRIVAYGLASLEAKYRAMNVVFNAQKTKATILRGGITLGELELGVPGEHNLKNALAAIAVSEILSIPFETARKALKRFGGAERRFEVKGEASGVLVIDDYAHHPTEIRATLETARKSYPNRRIIACFQPHTFTRTRDFAEDFGKAFAELADKLYLLDIYPARELPIDGVSSDAIRRSANDAGFEGCEQIVEVDDLPERVLREARPGDVIITIGAGTITNASGVILEALRSREQNLQPIEPAEA